MANPSQRKDFAAGLKDARAARNLRQTDLADQLRPTFTYTAQSVSAWERAENAPPREVVLAIEKVLRVPSGALAQHLGYAAEGEMQVSASGTDLDELLLADPDAYEQLMEQARFHLDRARKRRRKP